MKSLFIVVNVDWFFLSHRLPIALEAQKKGYKVTIVTADTGRRTEIESYGLRVVDLPFERSGTNPLHELKCILALARIYRRERPDVIHHVTLKASLLGSIAAKLTGNNQIVNAISGLGYNFTNGRQGVVQWVVKAMIRRAFTSKHFRFILQNPDDLEMLASLDLVPRDHLYLIKGSGVDLTQFKYTISQQSDKVRFLFPARILADKGVMELIEAALMLKEKYSDCAEFILAGDCDQHNLAAISEADLKRAIDDTFVQWVGFQKNIKLKYEESSVVVLPSYREGLPKSLIEACAIGRAIITTNVPGCRECVEPGYNGLLVGAKEVAELASACEYFILHREKIEEYGRNSRLKAEKEFGIEHVVEKTLLIYNKLANK